MSDYVSDNDLGKKCVRMIEDESNWELDDLSLSQTQAICERCARSVGNKF